MPNSNQRSLAERHLVDDLPGAVRVGARLSGIIQKINECDALTPLATSFASKDGGGSFARSGPTVAICIERSPDVKGGDFSWLGGL